MEGTQQMTVARSVHKSFSQRVPWQKSVTRSCVASCPIFLTYFPYNVLQKLGLSMQLLSTSLWSILWDDPVKLLLLRSIFQEKEAFKATWFCKQDGLLASNLSCCQEKRHLSFSENNTNSTEDLNIGVPLALALNPEVAEAVNPQVPCANLPRRTLLRGQPKMKNEDAQGPQLVEEGAELNQRPE